MQKVPHFIRVNADLYELVKGTVPDPAPEEYFVKRDIVALAKQQDKFVTGVDALLASVGKTNYRLLEPPLMALLHSVTAVTTNLRSMPRMFKYDAASEQFYAFETSRWATVDTLLSLAVQVTQDEIHPGMVDGLPEIQKALSTLKARHSKVVETSNKNTTRTVTADFDPDATQPIKAVREKEEVAKKESKPAEKLSKPEHASSVSQEDKQFGSAVWSLAAASKLVATATLETLGQYDEAAGLVADAHGFIKSAQMVNVKFGQTLKYAGATYRRV